MSKPKPPASGLSAPAAPVNPPVERASTLILAEAADMLRSGRTYGRDGLATHDALAAEIAKLEGGAASVLTPSGLAACTAAIGAHVKAGDHVLVTDGCYLPTRRFCERVLADFGVETTFYDPRAGAGIARLIREETRAIFMEQPSSLSFEVQDVRAIVAAARARAIITICDQSWGGGVAFKPLGHGVDVSVLSLTKYPSGASDVFLGAATSRDPAVAKRVGDFARAFGQAVSPDDAYLALRGLRSLETRMARHEASGLEIARWLAGRPEVAAVLHPALESHPDHALWTRDFQGASGLFGVVLRPAAMEKTLAFFDALQAFALGYSFGGFESLAILSDPQLAARAHAPVFDGPLIRLAVGLEPVDALIADLERALAALA